MDSSQWIYQVFLSFRGEDTCKNFSDHLYYALRDSGINAFQADNQVPRKDIGTNLMVQQALRKSRIFIIVFSRNYAASTSCLDQLLDIMECRKTPQQKVLPVFYDVDPSDVRKQTGSFAQAFARHEDCYSMLEMEKVARWRMALTEVANMSGWDLRNVANGHEAKFIKNIVEEILRELNDTYLFVAMHPVGLGSRLHDMNSLLNIGSDDVSMVGICGMGGIGKTTIAKAVYNQLFHNFESRSFLTDVRENFRTPHGQVRLQEQLIYDILKTGKIKLSNVDKGINIIKEKLCNRRVLLIVDDVDHLDQLHVLGIKRDWVGLGSRIIITSRDEHLLKQLGVDQIYFVENLSKAESLELFSWNAFRKAYPNDDFIKLSEAIVSYSNCLPLALIVLGSFLFERSIAEWKSALEKLKRIPHNDIQRKLKISFDALSAQEKEIFLDIACVFIGVDKNYAAQILDGCGFFAEIGINVLTCKCLVTLTEKNKLMMHDLLRDMGRDIIREESPKNPGRRSRLWQCEDVLDILKYHTGTEAVEVLLLNLPRPRKVHCSTEAFGRISKLRLLQLNYVHVTGCYELMSKELRWLCWHECPLTSIPNDFHMENMVAFDMQYSKLRQLWKGSKDLGKLKILNLSHSPYLTRTPDFSRAPFLEKLILKHCTSLVEFHPSVGQLDELVLLNVKNCRSLKNLPRSICKLKSLEILNLSGCSNVDKLPEDIGKIQSLRELIADRTMVSQLPVTIICLKNLRKLSLCGCKGASLSSLPSLICSWVSRKPKSSNLLPASLGGLSSLRELFLSDCNLSDGSIPQDIGKLPSLKILNLGSNSICSLPDSISGLPKLKTLMLDNCIKLQSLPELPATLSTLSAINCISLKRLPNMSKFEHAPDLYLNYCQNLVEIPGLENLDCNGRSIQMGDCNNLGGIARNTLLKVCCEGHKSSVILPGNDIPNWFTHQSVGTSVSFQMPPLLGHRFRGFSVCVVFALKMHTDGSIPYPLVSITNKTKMLDLDHKGFNTIGPQSAKVHMYAFDMPFDYKRGLLDAGDEVEVEVFGDGLTVKKCGVHLLFEDDGGRDIQLDVQGILQYDSESFAGNSNQVELIAKRSRVHVVDDNVDVGPSNCAPYGEPCCKRLKVSPEP